MTSRSEKQTGGPAFARAGHEWSDMEWVPAPDQAGMTLRDYFAAKAMQAFCSRPDSDIWEADEIAADAYSQADAMLKARDAKG